MSRRLERGYIQVYTGDGKGKTTAAFGLVLRATGRGLRSLIIQFAKGQVSGEVLAVAERWAESIEVQRFGTTCLIDPVTGPEPRDIDLAREGLRAAELAFRLDKYDIIVLDEVLVAIRLGLFSVADVLGLLDKKPADLELVLTGRYAPPEIIARADLVTEMKSLKHYYDNGVPARTGIED